MPLEDLHKASELLIRALLIREKYMASSMQNFPETTSRFLRKVHDHPPPINLGETVEHEGRKRIKGRVFVKVNLILVCLAFD